MKQNYISILFFCIMAFVAMNSFAQQESNQVTLQDYFGGKFSLQVFAGYSSLKVLPDFFIADEFPELPRIAMNTYGFRFGKLNYSKISTSTFWELSFSSSSGVLKLNSPENNSLSYKRNISNTMFGGAYGMWIPLYTRLNSPALSLTPKAILLNIKLGVDVMIISEEAEESTQMISPYSGGELFVYQSAPDEETIEGGDRVLFSVGMGIDYVLMKNVVLKLDGIIGAYPVSGPGNSKGEATGLPDEWGSNRMILFGLQLIL